MEGRRDVMDGSRLRTVREWSVERYGISREGAIPVTLEDCGPWFELRLELDRCRRAE
jgi:hypothetical protein